MFLKIADKGNVDRKRFKGHFYLFIIIVIIFFYTKVHRKKIIFHVNKDYEKFSRGQQVIKITFKVWLSFGVVLERRANYII